MHTQRSTPEDLEPGRWPWMQEANQIEMLAYLGTSPLASASFTDTLAWVITGVYDNTWNGIVRTRLREDVDATIDSVLESFRSCLVPVPSDWFPDGRPAPAHARVPYQWYVPEDSLPEDLGQRLEAHGCTRMAAGVGMGMDLQRLPAQSTAANMHVRPVRDAPDLSHWCAVTEGDPEQRRRRERIHYSLGLGPEAPYQRFLAWFDGEPAGAAAVFLSAHAAGLYDVKVLREFERRGIGTAVTVAALAAARDRGYRNAVLAPSPEGAVMYHRIGFRTYPYRGISY